MTMHEEYGRCRACGAVCDGDVCDQYCEARADEARAEQQHADREARGLCGYCGELPGDCDCESEATPWL